MTSVGDNFLCGPSSPSFVCVHLSTTPSTLHVDVINGWPHIFLWTCMHGNDYKIGDIQWRTEGGAVGGATAKKRVGKS